MSGTTKRLELSYYEIHLQNCRLRERLQAFLLVSSYSSSINHDRSFPHSFTGKISAESSHMRECGWVNRLVIFLAQTRACNLRHNSLRLHDNKFMHHKFLSNAPINVQSVLWDKCFKGFSKIVHVCSSHVSVASCCYTTRVARELFTLVI